MKISAGWWRRLKGSVGVIGMAQVYQNVPRIFAMKPEKDYRAAASASLTRVSGGAELTGLSGRAIRVGHGA